MNILIKFKLPEDREDLDIYMNAYKYYLVLKDLEEFFRGRAEHHEEDNDVHTEVYNRLIDILNERGIDI